MESLPSPGEVIGQVAHPHHTWTNLRSGHRDKAQGPIQAVTAGLVMPDRKQSVSEGDVSKDALAMAAAVLRYRALAGPGVLSGRHSSSQLLDAHMLQ